MSSIRVRFIGGALNGQAVWVEADCQSLKVRVAAKGTVTGHTLEYRREGDLLRFVPDAAPPIAGA